MTCVGYDEAATKLGARIGWGVFRGVGGRGGVELMQKPAEFLFAAAPSIIKPYQRIWGQGLAGRKLTKTQVH